MGGDNWQWDAPDPVRKTYAGSTPQQVLDFIQQYVDRRGFSPSWEEIKEGCGFGSKSTVHAMLRQMQDRGLVVWAPGIGRSIRVVPQDA